MKEIFSTKRFSRLVPISIFILLSIIYTLPIIYTFSNWGRGDWDQFSFWSAVPRITMLEYHQFPLWNPYGNGGNVLLAHPHSSFLSPFYILVLFFGPLIGLKLEIIVYLFLGMAGMYLLSRHLQLTKISSYVPAFLFMLSSIYPLRITEGHLSWLPMAFFPWLLLFYEKSLKNKRYLFGGILSFSLMHLAGSVDVLHISVTFLSLYALFKTIQRKSADPLKILIFILVGAALLCAVKVVPMAEFLSQHPRLTTENHGVGIDILAKMLLDGKQALCGGYGWHEYGAYVGIFPLLFAGIGVIVRGKRQWPLFLTGIICLIIAMGSKAPLNLWKLLHSLPVYDSLHAPARYILGFILCVSLFCGMAFSRLEQFVLKIKKKRKQLLSQTLLIAGAGAIFLNLYFVNSPILEKAFTNLPVHLKRHKEFRQRYAHRHIPQCKHMRSMMYPAALSNSGIVPSYEVLKIKQGNIKTVDQLDYRGEAYLVNDSGNISMVSFSPNKVVVDVNVHEVDNVVLNQNYYTGWRVIDNGKRMSACPYNGLISTLATPGHHKITFYYLPLSFLIGLGMSSVFILMIMFSYRENIKRMSACLKKLTKLCCNMIRGS